MGLMTGAYVFRDSSGPGSEDGQGTALWKLLINATAAHWCVVAHVARTHATPISRVRVVSQRVGVLSCRAVGDAGRLFPRRQTRRPSHFVDAHRAGALRWATRGDDPGKRATPDQRRESRRWNGRERT